MKCKQWLLKRRQWLLFAAIPVAIILIWWFVGQLLPEWAGVTDTAPMNNKGTFGDMFGAINALFSGLALAGVIVAIYLQSQELKEQREELRLTREEIKGQKREMEMQNKTLYTQRFEQTFFNMLDNFHNHVRNETTLEHDIFAEKTSDKYYSVNVIDTIHDTIMHNNSTNDDEHPDSFIENYLEIHANFGWFIIPYVSGIYYIIQFIYGSDLNSQEKMIYVNVLVSNLTAKDQMILFDSIAALSEIDTISDISVQVKEMFTNTKLSIEKCSLLRFFNPDNFFPKHVRDIFDPSAYMLPEDMVTDTNTPQAEQ